MAKRLQLLSPLKGESAYELARKNGFEGTEAEWITSLQGVDGKSAYEYAKESGYTGTEEEFYQKLTEDCIPTPSTATVGQTIAVKTVDESGKPTEWEAVDITPTDPDALASLSGQVAALQTSIRPYEWAVTSTSIQSNGWSTFLDLPTERFYRFNNSVPESFGLPVTGKNGTLVAFDASNASTNWFVMYICAALISSTEEKYYVTYANKTASLSNAVWKELVTDREQLLQDAIDSASGQFIEGLSGLVLGVDRPKIVLLGDSVMAGVGTSDYSATGDLVINKTFTNGRTFEIYRDVGAKSWAAQFKAHMESTYPGCSVTNNGVPGFTTWQLSDSMDVLVPEDADIAIVQIGTNSRNADDKTALIIDPMKVIIDHLRDNGITPIIMTNTVLLNQTAPNDAQNVRQCIMAACAEKGVYCYDVLGEMEWYLANHGMAASDIMTDDLHPNDDGHALIFEIYKKLLRVGDGGVINIVENPSTSSSGLYVGTEEPTDSNATVWIDTDDSEAIDCIPTPSTATVGQTIVVEKVDESGKPTSWKCVDVAGGTKLLVDYITEQEIFTSEIPGAEFSEDLSGNSFCFKNVMVRVSGTVVNDVDTDSNVRVWLNGLSTSLINMTPTSLNSDSTVYAIISADNASRCSAITVAKTIGVQTLPVSIDKITAIRITGNNYNKTHLAAGASIKIWGWD